MTAFLALRFVLEVIGYATLPDDAKEAHGVLRVLADMVLALPWWAIWWPLFLSYVATCLMALDFSFDIFKREPKAVPPTQLETLAEITYEFMRYFSFIETDTYKFIDDEGAIEAVSELEIFRKKLSGFGIDTPEINETAEQVMYLKAVIARYRPYLPEGDITEVIAVANTTIRLLE